MKNLKKGFNLKKELIKKHLVGQKKYGAFSFLNDKRNMELEAADELLDSINYLVYRDIKKFFGKRVIKKWTPEIFNSVYKAVILNLINNFSIGSGTMLKKLIQLAEELKEK